MQLYDEINICFVIDDNYAEHCAVTIASILLNSDSVFHFHVLYNDLSLKNKNRLDNLKKIKNFEITFVTVDLMDFKECYLQPNSHFTVATYFRLKIASLLPDIDKIIYLDSDTVVNRDLKELWSIAFDDAYIIACKTIAHESNCKRLGLPTGTPCINAGVMVLDLNKMRKHGLENIFFECLKQNIDKLKYADQDVINLVLSNDKGAIKHIQQNWNMEDATCLVYKEDYLPILDDPYIIHFMTGEKPWLPNSRQRFKEKYWQYHREVALVNPGKLVMTLLVRNEEDIVRYNIDFHLSKGVDFIIATDNGSTDGTLDILHEYEKKGVLRLIEEPQHNHNQAAWNNRMAQMARDKYGADFIFHCDADEFWFPRSGSLKHEIASRPEDILSVNLTNVLLADRDGEETFPNDARYAVVQPIIAENYEEETKSGNLFFYQYPTKVIFKTGKKMLLVQQGNHAVTNKDDLIKEATTKDIIIYHYPVRSKAKFVQKTIMGGRAYEKNKIVPKSYGFHKRRWYEMYKKGLLEQEYKKLIIDDAEAKKLLCQGFIEELNFYEMIKEKTNQTWDEWRFYNRKFEYEESYQNYHWPWAGHKRFAYDLVRNNMPQTIVDLGTYNATSFFSFCQAVKDAHYNANLYAVDTWKGDEHAGFYSDDVFVEGQGIKEKYYGNLKIELLRQSLDEALGHFADNSIDLLHIDGLDTYDGVKHAFGSWFPKVKQDGFILLHDIIINRSDFGVYKFWEELKREYKTIEFHHSYGLGVLFKDSALYQALIGREKEWQIRYSCIAEDKKNTEIGKYLYNSERSLAERDGQIARLNQAMAEKDRHITALYQSTSWQMTRPLRNIGRQLKRLRRMISSFFCMTYEPDVEPKISQGFRGEELQIPDENGGDPLISVVMPVYNACRHDKNFILCALESIANQSYKKIELIIVDDGSTDGSRQICKDFLSTRPDLCARYFSKKNGGQSSARNYGIKNCSGEYVAFLDQDDEWYHDKLEQIVPWLRNKSIDMLYTDADTMDGEGKITQEGIHKNLLAGWPHPKKSVEDILFKDIFVMPGLMTIKKEALEKVGGFDEDLSGYEDDDLFLRLFEKCKIFYLPVSTLRWRMYNANYSFSSRMLTSRTYYWKKLIKKYSENSSNKMRAQRISLRFFWQFVIQACYQYSKRNDLYAANICGAREIVPYLPKRQRFLVGFIFLLPLKYTMLTLTLVRKTIHFLNTPGLGKQRRQVG